MPSVGVISRWESLIDWLGFFSLSTSKTQKFANEVLRFADAEGEKTQPMLSVSHDVWVSIKFSNIMQRLTALLWFHAVCVDDVLYCGWLVTYGGVDDFFLNTLSKDNEAHTCWRICTYCWKGCISSIRVFQIVIAIGINTTPKLQPLLTMNWHAKTAAFPCVNLGPVDTT